MCGRYTLIDLARFTDLFPWLRLPGSVAGARFNIAPTQPVLAVPNDASLTPAAFHWGLIPWWAEDPAVGGRMINARVETLSQRAAFKESLRLRRCAVLADGFFEWRKEGRRRIPLYIRLKGGRPFFFAGLWDVWRKGGDPVRSCTVITTDANELVAPIHNRMPVILRDEDVLRWLEPGEQASERMQDLLGKYPAEQMEAVEVSAVVNRAEAEGPECVRPAGEQPGGQGELFGSFPS